ncbi:SEC10/PgrA surface exclusion domain-containing protein [Limosilactobacillus vaginalis]|uniref:SEC10/PgrA surface exclusion domain-containing protein n=1 Tax=Limosilactobacillus vaginalis TaxID=1633 RepID=UPI0025A331E7|nr:SEC10/PgrA surface exclusion domain-containing protein [Limosilactobacillus vaginalis]MDM8243779.1 SEC10/PgrA surface exclusion domain-containing protein [Limosilactobacillus vaginalis]
MKNKVAKLTVMTALTAIAGLGFTVNNVKADTSVDGNTEQVVNTQVQSTQASTTPSYVQLYSDNLTQVKAAQTINFPSGYTLDAIRNVPDQWQNPTAAKAASDELEKTAIQGMYNNNYQSDPAAAKQAVDINNLTTDQVKQINQYGLGIVNQARAEFGEQPFNQSNGTIDTARKMSLQYQAKNESLMTGGWHDQSIIQGNAENIAAFQIYADSIPEFNNLARPFATAKGSDLVNNNNIPLFKITTMDDLQACVYYGIMGMLFNDADDYFGHAKNFLTINQPINSMALYPSLTFGLGNGSINSIPVKYRVENIDIHYLWVLGNENSNSFGNNGTVAVWNTNDNGNYAWLDGVNTTNNGQLTVTGWHATNASQGRIYHYIIVLDQNNHEIARKLVTSVSRPDVQKAHNVYNATNSGFSTSLDLGNALANTDSVRIISRYSSAADGNSGYVDYWFAPVSIDQNNYACLDNVSVINGKLQFAGWNATNRSANRKYHYIILIDHSNGNREIARQLVTTDNNRADVANVYPNIDGAATSGFKVGFDLSKLNLNHQLQIISRYTDDPAGNGNYVDYWFSPVTGNYSNQGYLDNFVINNSGQVVASGWHANDVTKFEQNHFIILYDMTSNKQVAVIKTTNITRNDVAKAYPSIRTAANSGFKVSFDLPKNSIISGHKYVVVSRYSTSDQGNGDQGQYTDYWYDPKNLL